MTAVSISQEDIGAARLWLALEQLTPFVRQAYAHLIFNVPRYRLNATSYFRDAPELNFVAGTPDSLQPGFERLPGTGSATEQETWVRAASKDSEKPEYYRRIKDATEFRVDWAVSARVIAQNLRYNNNDRDKLQTNKSGFVMRKEYAADAQTNCIAVGKAWEDLFRHLSEFDHHRLATCTVQGLLHEFVRHATTLVGFALSSLLPDFQQKAEAVVNMKDNTVANAIRQAKAHNGVGGRFALWWAHRQATRVVMQALLSEHHIANTNFLQTVKAKETGALWPFSTREERAAAYASGSVDLWSIVAAVHHGSGQDARFHVEQRGTSHVRKGAPCTVDDACIVAKALVNFARELLGDDEAKVLTTFMTQHKLLRQAFKPSADEGNVEGNGV